MQVCVGLIMLAVCLIQVSLLLTEQQGLLDFFRYRPMLPIGWRIVQILRQHRSKTTNTAPTTLCTILYKNQANPLLSVNNYTPSRNDKNEHLTLLSQRKLALTAINKLFAL
jgi:hypothetical protein